MKLPVAGMVLMVAAFGLVAAASPLEDRLKAFSDPTGTQSEAVVTDLLKAGVSEHRSAEALAAVQPWLNRNSLETPAGLFYAGQASEYSGQWNSAVGYYQRLLQLPESDAALAAVAADSVYRLLLTAVGDDNAAYLFMRQDGNRIRSFGQAKRYDRWFLDQARQRRDLVAIAERLTAIALDKSAPLADFEQDVAWLCTQLEGFRKEDAGAYESALKLADAERTPAVYKARLRWPATAMPYNQKLDELRNANAPVDPKLTEAPLAAAAELLKVAPDHGAFVVAEGWGVEYDDSRSGHCALRFAVEGSRKLAQLLEAVHRMSPELRDDLLGYPIAQGRVTFDVQTVRDLVIKYPDMLDSLDAAEVRLYVKDTTTLEDAKALAPLLGRYPHADGAGLRAIAKCNSLAFGPVAEAITTSEMWRFDSGKAAVDWALRNAASREENHRAVAQQLSRSVPAFEQMQKEIRKQASSEDRMAAFDKLLKDLMSPVPSIPGALSLWNQLFDNAPPADNIKMLQKLITADIRGDRELLLRRALPVARVVGNHTMPFQAVPHYTHYKTNAQAAIAKAAVELLSHVRGVLEQQMRAGKLSPLLFAMWVHNVNTRDQSNRDFVKALAGSAAYAQLDAAYRQSAADELHFGPLALTPAEAAAQPSQLSRELLDLPKDADQPQVEHALAAVIARMAALPQPSVVVGVDKVASLKEWSPKTRQQVLSLFREHAPLGKYPTRQGYEQLIERLCAELDQRKQWGEIEPFIAGLWRAAASPEDGRHQRGAAALIRFSESALQAEALSAAMAVTRGGLESRTGRELAERTEPGLPELVGRMRQAMGKAAIGIGLIDIPVDTRDPAYGIYKSQSEFALGNTAAAWELYDNDPARAVTMLRQLTVPYSLWLLEQNIAARQSDRAEALIKELTIWSRQTPGVLTSEQEGELKIAYADAAFQNGSLQTARAWYRRVAEAEQYRHTPLQYKAMLRTVDVDRAARDFAGALAELDKLMQVRDEPLRIKAHYARAEVLFDQENYAEAFSEVSTVLRRDPGNADALILLGKAQLQMRKLVDASEIELGATRDQKMIVPGELIKINLSDPVLNVSGVGADIEVEVWTKSGDRERVMLRQLGDDKTKFRAEIPTRLDARQPGDKVLQVLGRDEIRYGYSARFREKMKDLPPDPEVVITVASDARMAASAGAFPAREGERKLDLDELGVSTAQQALGTRQVRPGNPVYIRVTDPDQSRTDEIDQIVVAIETTNGDAIPRLVLRETGTHTGEFQGTVPTDRAQALAYASESAPGRDANMVISSKPYPGWSGVVTPQKTERTFVVDLNDNVPLDTMTIRCEDTAQALTHFVIQTSMNGRDWATRARFPANPAPWDGQPQITAFATYGRGIGVSVPTGRDVPEDWRQKMEITSAGKDVPYNALHVKSLSNLNVDLPSGGHPGYSVLMRYRALFYQPASAIRTFRLTGLPADANTLFLIDGQPAELSAEDPMTIRRELRAGLHEIEIWRHESRHELLQRKPTILCDTPDSDELSPCPDSMFTPQSFPQGVRDTVAGPTAVTSSNDGAAQFAVAFGQNTRARLVRLAIVEHEGAAPVISKISLTDRDGVRRLPLESDYQQLRSNDQLEIVPGEQVVVRYEDDQTINPRKANLQDRLTVAYNTATISASFLNYVQTEEGRELVLEPIRRFKLDDSVAIVVNDPDLDQTPQPDQLVVNITSSGGQTTSAPALETGPHTGVFIARVFPVSSQAQRESEIMVPEGGTLTAIYRDSENLDPGIPTDRTVTIEHARYAQPSMAVYHTSARRLPESDPEPDKDDDENDKGEEVVTPQFAVTYEYRDGQALAESSPRTLVGGTLRFDVIAPHLAFARSSEVVAYVQTQSGRAAHDAGQAAGNAAAFDIRVPGTLKVTATPSREASITAPPGYAMSGGANPPNNMPPLDEGRFAFAVPIALGDVPSESFATDSAQTMPSSMMPDALAVRPGDRLYIGFAYLDPDGQPQWLSADAELDSHVMLDVMTSRYSKPVTAVYVGEKVYIRLIAPHLDAGPDRDVTSVAIKADSGAATTYSLSETEAHSGVFKGSFTLSYADQPVTDPLPSVVLHGLPVKYGDRVTLAYSGPVSEAPPVRTVAVNKGADGLIEPFSKRYGDDSVAVQTTFTLAECFFELAKNHREMEQESLARREMGHAQKLLAEAMESHRDDQMRAHAEYLLGNLAQEYADLSQNDASRTQMYQDALARFSRITLDYADSEFAPKAQFKKALVYEKLGELDIAVEEYVKLAYKYPEHELIPSVMSRLGAYFQDEGQRYKAQSEEAAKNEEDVEARGEALRLMDLAVKEYLKAAQVFKKLQDRFPSDPLAGLAGLRSAQNYMRAGDYAAAIEGFQVVFDHEQYDDKTVRSQAMFWAGISHERSDNLREAYELYRRITFDFPDSVWAKQARGRLADPAFADIIRIEELERERMLEALKEQKKKG